MPISLYVEPPGTVLEPGPQLFGLPGDKVDPGDVPQPYINGFDGNPTNGKPNFKAKFFEPAYVKQVGENYAEIGAPDSRSIQSMIHLDIAKLGHGIVDSPQYNLLQPVPFWNVHVTTPTELAAYEQQNKVLVTQVPAEYVPGGAPNLYLGK